jgi:hypothetical protein
MADVIAVVPVSAEGEGHHAILLTSRNRIGRMNRAIKKIAKWAQSQGWTVEDDASGYTRFYDLQGNYVARYPATPSNPRRRMAELEGKLNKSGLQLPPPSKKEQRAKRHHDDQRRTRR